MGDMSPEERLARLEAEMTALKCSMLDQFTALNLRLDEVIISQVKDHGKRIQALEERGVWMAGWIAGAWAIGSIVGSGLVLLLICIKLLFAGKGKKADVRPASALMKQTELGGTYIALEAIDSMVQKHCRAVPRVKNVHTTLQSTETGVTIGIRLCVMPDTDVVTLSSELQKSLKENVESLTGIQVNEIGVLVESAAPVAATTAVSRAE